MSDSAQLETERAPRRRRRALLLLVPVTVAGALTWSRVKPLTVTASPAERGKAIEAVYATGTVEAALRRTLRARTGGLVVEVRVQEGDHVRAGDLLVRIDAAQLTGDVRRGRADFDAASAQSGPDAPHLSLLNAQAAALEADLKLARLDRDRTAKLRAVDAATAAELDRVEARVSTLAAQLAANRAQARATAIDLSSAKSRSAAALSTLSAKLDETEIRAPIDGVVLWRSVEPGEQVSRDQPLLRVGDTRDLIIESYVDEADVARVSDGADGRPRSPVVVSLYGFPGRPMRGQVDRVMPDAQRERKAFLVKLRLDAPPAGLRSGMSAEINIVTAQKDDAVVVPSEAVRDGALWVVRGSRARRVAATVGVHDLLRTEILRGVAPGDLVVTDGTALREGRWVRAEVQPMDRYKPLPAPAAVAQSLTN